MNVTRTRTCVLFIVCDFFLNTIRNSYVIYLSTSKLKIYSFNLAQILPTHHYHDTSKNTCASSFHPSLFVTWTKQSMDILNVTLAPDVIIRLLILCQYGKTSNQLWRLHPIQGWTKFLRPASAPRSKGLKCPTAYSTAEIVNSLYKTWMHSNFNLVFA